MYKYLPIASMFAVMATSLSCFAAPADRFAAVEMKAHHVSGSIHMLEGAGGNIGVSIGADGTLIVDDQYAPLADKIIAALKDLGGDRPKLMTLLGQAFCRRFLLHVLPKGFVRIRHYGLLANSVRRDRIALCREILGVAPDAALPVSEETWQDLLLRLTGLDVTCCPRCGGSLRVVKVIASGSSTLPVEERAASP